MKLYRQTHTDRTSATFRKWVCLFVRSLSLFFFFWYALCVCVCVCVCARAHFSPCGKIGSFYNNKYSSSNMSSAAHSGLCKLCVCSEAVPRTYSVHISSSHGLSFMHTPTRARARTHARTHIHMFRERERETMFLSYFYYYYDLIFFFLN